MSIDHFSTIQRCLFKVASIALLVVLVAATAMTSVTTAYAAPLVFTVNSINDYNDGACNSTHCSLREAINAANANSGTDTIRFNVVGTGPFRIRPASVLPTVTDPVIIDGTTQPGYSGVPLIELSGSLLSNDDIGLTISAGDSTIRGLVVNGFRYQVALIINGGNHIEANYIGTNAAGTAQVRGPFYYTMGGIYVLSSNNMIGGTTESARNVISAYQYSIYLDRSGPTSADNNVIQGNYIGTDATGTIGISPNTGGVHILGSNNLVGGTVNGARNIISGLSGAVTVFSDKAVGNIIQGNYMGTDVTGTHLIGNRVGVTTNGSYTLIGGPTPEARNVISGSSDWGVIVGAEGLYAGANNNIIQGNYIGTDATGTTAMSNRIGVALGTTYSYYLDACTNNQVIDNVISGNTTDGVKLAGIGHSAKRNLIGTDATGSVPLGNGGDGIEIGGSSTYSTIEVGGWLPEDGNVIAFNGGNGVSVTNMYLHRFIASNRIYANNLLGIDLGINGLDANDALDPDTGANNSQNYPVITAANTDATGLVISGMLNSTPYNTFNIQVYSNQECDPSGNGEGQNLLGTLEVSTDGSGNATFSANYVPLAAGQFITATATGPDGTSEFSLCHVVGTLVGGPGTPTPVSPRDTISTNLPIFTWEKSSNSTGYELAIDNASGNVYTGAFDAATVCTATSCNATPSVPLDDGDYTWKVRGINEAGNGSWSSLLSFTVSYVEPPTPDSLFIVTTTDDVDDGTCDVTHCSLREAITASNANADTSTIRFNISGAGQYRVLSPHSELPDIVQPVTIDGTSQPGYSDRPLIVLSGSSAGVQPTALTISAGNSTVKGLAITAWYDGIKLLGAGGNSIQGNYIGSDLLGPNGGRNSHDGIQITSPNNVIGGTTSAARNVISGNSFGITINGSAATNNVVQGNYIGTNRYGTGAISNSNYGIVVEAPYTIIGGIEPGTGNVVSGNALDGILVEQTGLNTLIQGNYIGVDVTGSRALPNGYDGISVYGPNTTIGGTTAAARNIISANASNGVTVSVYDMTGTVIQGNYIGVGIAGTEILGNSENGVIINGSNITVGGVAPGSGNVISGNGKSGISSGYGEAHNSVIQRNIVGLAANGLTVIGNEISGIAICGTNNLVGGTSATARNVISGNGYDSTGTRTGYDGFGIEICESGINNTIQGNYIGTDITGTLDRGNYGSGVYLDDGATGTVIGGTITGAGNVISGNDKHGIELLGSGTQNNIIQGNLIGTSKTGMAVLRNSGSGIILSTNARGNTIGGITPPARNIISGNAGGVMLNSGASGNMISGNYIGTDITGLSALSNQAAGVSIRDSSTMDNVIGGAVAGAGNLISGNGQFGISISGSNIGTNTIEGNIIGPNASGTGSIGTQQTGISISNAPRIVIGGPSALAGNLISGNTTNGIQVSFTTYNRGNLVTIIGNRIGTNLSGSSALPNGNGISLTNASTLLADNLVAFHTGSGKYGVRSATGELIGSTNNCIQGNTTGLAIVSQPQTTITYNWWGSASGPQLSGNPGGTGNPITGSAADLLSLQFSPFLTSTPSSGCGVGTPQVAAPSNLNTIPVSGSRIALTWTDNSSDETGFRIQRAVGTGNWIDIGTVPANTTSFSDTSLMCETAYFYRVFAERSTDHHTSSPSEESAAATLFCPLPPVDLIASEASETTIDLNWMDASSDETNFRIERSNDGSTSWVEIGTAEADATGYSDTTLSCNTTRYYRVRTYRSSDEQYSAYSNTSNATTSACPPPDEPMLTSPTNGSTTPDNTPTFDWEDVTGATEYQIQVDNNAGFTSLEVDTTTTSSGYTPATLLVNGTYSWRVRAGNGSWSAYSSPWTVTLNGPVLGVGLHEETDTSLSYTGVWTTWSGSGPSGGSLKYTNTPSASITFQVTGGTRLKVYRQLDSNRGMMRVCVDATCEDVNNYSPTSLFQQAWTSATFDTGLHAVTITNLETTRYMDLDAIEVLGPVAPLGVGSYEETHTGLTYTGTWTSWSGAGPSGGSLKYTNTPSASISFEVVGGTRLKVYRQLDSNRGMMRVCVDATCEDVNNYSATSLFQQAWTSATFDTGLHAVTITNLETTRYMDLDAIEVLGPVPPLGVGSYEETHTGLTYTGTWTTWSGAGPSGGSMKYTNSPAASISFQVMGGTGLKVYRQTASNRGMMRVCVDATCEDVNNYSAESLFQQVWTSAAFSTGLHTVTITNLETTRYMDLDAVEVLGPVVPLGVGLHEETSSNLSYTGVWTTWSGSGPSGGSMKYTNSPAASITFQVTGGTRLKVYRQVASNRGMMRVCVDATCEDVNNYSAESLFQQEWTSAAFDTGLHTVTITNLETTRYMDLDAVEVLGPVVPLGVGLHEETSSNLSYTGVWTTWSGAGPSGGSMKYTNTPSASITFQVTGGTRLKVYRQVASNRGMMRVCVDATCEDINNYSAESLFQQEWTSAAFSTGLHTVTITNLETTRYMDLDAIEVLGPVAPLGVGSYEETHTGLTYTGTWTTWSGAGPSGGSMKYTNTPSASITFQVTGGTRLKVYRQVASNRGMMRVCVDATCEDVNNYSAESLFQQVWTSAAFSTGLHTVTITNLETTRYMDLDAIEVLGPVPPLGVGSYEETHTGLTYTGTWASWSGTGPSGGSLRYTDAVGASVSFSITGAEGIVIYRTQDVNRGIMEVCVDGTAPANCTMVNNYSPTTVWASPWTLSGLSSSVDHTVVIRCSTARIDLDAIQVLGPA